MKEQIEKPSGPYHDFWLFKEGERKYSDYDDLLGRKDAPIRIPDDILHYYYDWFVWMKPINPSGPEGDGFNYYGPTVINKKVGKLFREICEQFSILYRKGPQKIILSGGPVAEYGDDGNIVDEYHIKYEIDKSWIAGVFNKLADFAKQAENGTHFIIHLGV